MSVNLQKVGFHFVAGNPQSESEKRNVRTIVRSNASHRRWRLVRETAEKSKARSHSDGMINLDSTDDAEPISTDAPPSPDQSRKPKPVKKQRQIKNQRRVSETTRRPSAASSETSSTTLVDDEVLPDIPPLESPLKVTNLAQNYFGLMPSSYVSRQSIARMLQGTAVSYTNLFPPGKNAQFGNMAKDWFQQCLKTRGILHTALYCQAKRAQAMRPGMMILPTNELVICQTEALHAINEKLTQSNTACDDESLRIVFSLTWHGAIKQDMPQYCPRQVPMGDLQSLRLFMGVISYDPIHAQGLDDMIALRGGLHSIEMPGLAFLISTGDILLASLGLRRPRWSYGSYAQHNVDARAEDWINVTTRIDHPLRMLGTGFDALPLWLPFHHATCLQKVFSDLSNYTRASDDYLNAREESYGRAVMTDQRNSAQHYLMSLALTNDDQFDQRNLFELCWLAGVAYSFVSTYPLAPNAAPFGQIAHRIRLKMSEPVVTSHWSEVRPLMLWITVLGAVCAIGTLDRMAFVDVLRQQCWEMGIQTWMDLRARLMNFLWFPVASDLDGIDLWKEMEASGRITSWQDSNVVVP